MSTLIKDTILIPVSKEIPREQLKTCLQLIVNKASSKLLLLHVTTYHFFIELTEVVAAKTENLQEELIENEKREIEEMAEELEEIGYQVDTSTPVGFFDSEFIHKANEINPDLIIMFTAGSHSAIEDIFGTHTSAVFSKIQSPILVIPYQSKIVKFNTAVVGLDTENDHLHILNDYLKFAEEHQLSSSFVTIDGHFQPDSSQDGEYLNELRKLYPLKIEDVVHRTSGNIGVGLENYADEMEADLIVLFTTKRLLIEKLFHKSVTKDMVLHSKKPLLIYHY